MDNTDELAKFGLHNHLWCPFVCEREREEIKKEQHQRPGDPATQTGTVVGTTTVQWNDVPKSIGPNLM